MASAPPRAFRPRSRPTSRAAGRTRVTATGTFCIRLQQPKYLFLGAEGPLPGPAPQSGSGPSSFSLTWSDTVDGPEKTLCAFRNEADGAWCTLRAALVRPNLTRQLACAGSICRLDRLSLADLCTSVDATVDSDAVLATAAFWTRRLLVESLLEGSADSVSSSAIRERLFYEFLENVEDALRLQ